MRREDDTCTMPHLPFSGMLAMKASVGQARQPGSLRTAQIEVAAQVAHGSGCEVLATFDHSGLVRELIKSGQAAHDGASAETGPPQVLSDDDPDAERFGGPAGAGRGPVTVPDRSLVPEARRPDRAGGAGGPRPGGGGIRGRGRRR